MTVRRLLDEHHRRQVIEIPVRWDLDKIRLLPSHQRLHPLRCGSSVVDLRPAVANANVVGMKIVMHEAVIVAEAMLRQQLIGHVGKLPPRGNVANWPLPRHLSNELDRLEENILFLSGCHRDRVLVGVSMCADFVAGFDNHTSLVRKGFDGVSRDEPGGFDAILVKELEKTGNTDLTGKEAT